EAEDLLGRHLLEQMPGNRTDGLFERYVEVVETGRAATFEQYYGHERVAAWFQTAVVKLGDGFAVSFADITDRKNLEARLEHAALHDELTGLPNRSLFCDRLDQAIRRARRTSSYRYAVLFLDFDRFKIVNDSLGHEVGDQLLVSIADRIQTNLRSSDASTLVGESNLPARLGGDEFVILLDGVRDVRDASVVAGRLQQALGRPHMLGRHEVTSTASIGIVTSDGRYERADEVLRDADTAMYHAKNSGKAKHVVFHERMHREVVNRLDLERELRNALEQGQLGLCYQPIVALDSGRVLGLEASIRWRHARLGDISFERLLSIAEETGLSVQLGRWMLQEAAGHVGGWSRELAAHTGDRLGLHLNLGRRQLLEQDFVDELIATLEATELTPSELIVEVDESIVMNTMCELVPVLNRLSEQRVRLAIDGFGMGESSLTRIHRLPVDMLKIDREFIGSLEQGMAFTAVMRSIIVLAHSLDLTVVAGGVASRGQLAQLQALECDAGQGPCFAMPLPTRAVASYLQGAVAEPKIA
ncbi:MAG: putative bifunctional diguanylate cyclase/phosphodiesterase, partial [Planctomycetota bacterium]